MTWISDPNAWVALATLTAIETVLGIDNIVFISILTDRLPPHQRLKAWRLGLSFAILTRIALLFSLTWFLGLTEPWFSLFNTEFSLRDLILIGGGLFLLGKSTVEIHNKLEGLGGENPTAQPTPSFFGVILQIGLLDIVFSLDSVITAVGLANNLTIMVLAIVIAILTMMIFAEPINDFVDAHPTIKMLALSFLLLIGLALVAEGFDLHIPKGYIYFAMAFSVFVELLNIRAGKKKGAPVKLRKSYEREEARSDSSEPFS